MLNATKLKRAIARQENSDLGLYSGISNLWATDTFRTSAGLAPIQIVSTKVPLYKRPEIDPVPRDRMPASVAGDMLCFGYLSNGMTKTCWDARQTHFAAVAQARPFSYRYADRLRSVTWAQIAKWKKRSVYRLSEVTRAQNRFARMTEQVRALPPMQKLSAGLALSEHLLLQKIELLSDEIERRDRLQIELLARKNAARKF